MSEAHPVRAPADRQQAIIRVGANMGTVEDIAGIATRAQRALRVCARHRLHLRGLPGQDRAVDIGIHVAPR